MLSPQQRLQVFSTCLAVDTHGLFPCTRRPSSIAHPPAVLVREGWRENGCAASAPSTVRRYKSLATVERAFRSLKTVDLKVRPIDHRAAERVSAHVFLCTPAYYLEWRMRRLPAPLLFDDDDAEAARARRSSIVAPAQRSVAAVCAFRRVISDLLLFVGGSFGLEVASHEAITSRLAAAIEARSRRRRRRPAAAARTAADPTPPPPTTRRSS